MKIQTITSESGRDFSAVMECEHCGGTHKITSGYHDTFYHTRVIPDMTCNGCGKNRSGVVPAVRNDNGLVPVATPTAA